MRTLYLCGGGNSEGVRLALSINEDALLWGRMLVLDDDPAKRGQKLMGVEIAGGFDLLAEASSELDEVANLVARTTAGRRGARERIAGYGIPFAPLISPEVETRGAELAHDVIVYQYTTIGPEVTIGKGSCVFMGAVVGHESRVGPGCVLAANSVLNARVELGEGVYVGTNATVLPEVKVGAGATVGAGSVVMEDVPAGATVLGVPAHVIARPVEAIEQPVERAGPPPSPELERDLRGIWSEVLGLPDVGPLDNFFDVGGSSLLAIRAQERIERELGHHLDPIDVFRFPSVRALAGHLASARGGAGAAGPGAQRAAIRRRMRERRG